MSKENLTRFVAVKSANHISNNENAYFVHLFPPSVRASSVQQITSYVSTKENTYSSESRSKLNDLMNWNEENKTVLISDIEDYSGQRIDDLNKLWSEVAGVAQYKLTASAQNASIENDFLYIKLINFLLLKKNNALKPCRQTLDTFIQLSFILLPEQGKKQEPITHQRFSIEADEQTKAVNSSNKELENDLKTLEGFYQEITSVLKNNKYRYIPETKAKTSVSKKGKPEDVVEVGTLNELEHSKYHADFILNPLYHNKLSKALINYIKDNGFDSEEIKPISIKSFLEDEIDKNKRAFQYDDAGKSSQELVMIGGSSAVYKDEFLADENVQKRVFAFTIYNRSNYQIGVGDLLILKQKLKAYQLADIAHVENVLSGEERKREHRRLSLREENYSFETETETETEKDLQSTERNEMQNETQRSVNEQFQLDAGIQVSASYGPFFSFSANMNTSFSNSTQETQRKATNYSRELTEKSSEKISARIKEERKRRVLEESEEINLHKLNNTDNPQGHIRGVYRWLNKIYDAQIFNYGKRMMFDFNLPEPAAFFIYSKIKNPEPSNVITIPSRPLFNGRELKPKDLTEFNYTDYVSKYNVTNAPAPPTKRINVAYFDKADGITTTNYARASKIEIPEGYEAKSVRIQSAYVHSVAYRWFRIYIAGIESVRGIQEGRPGTPVSWNSFHSLNAASYPRKEVSVVLQMAHIQSFSVGIDVECELTNEAKEKWQLSIYNSIIQTYQNELAIAEEKMKQRELQNANKMEGNNPIINRKIEKDELKKLCVMVLEQNNNLNFDSVDENRDLEPLLDLRSNRQNSSIIRFLENAFEWNNITYVFYPYFWGRHATWIKKININDKDDDFTSFLKAGAARVQVPVRPGFERAIAYYCQTGQMWEGNDAPVVGDELYVPIIQELSESTGRIENMVPYPPDGQPWEVTVPTSLVVVQNLEELPVIRDVLTNSPIQLVNNRLPS